jgi:predicted RNA binding protein YcfA (HicA-like mRNA interferase family)
VLKRVGPDAVAGCVVPLHAELAVGTLRGILKQAGVTAENFIDKL